MDVGRIGGLAAALSILAGAGTALAASQPSFVTAVIDKGTASGLVAGFRTSDITASFVKCTISGSSATCSVQNNNSSIPKNLGNIVCLPVANAAYKLSDRCSALLKNGAGNCQSNSAASQCGSGTTPVFPSCNYRTTSNSSTSANWVLPSMQAATASIACKPATRGRRRNRGACCRGRRRVAPAAELARAAKVRGLRRIVGDFAFT